MADESKAKPFSSETAYIFDLRSHSVSGGIMLVGKPIENLKVFPPFLEITTNIASACEIDHEPLPDGTRASGGPLTWFKIADLAFERAGREGRQTHANIFDRLAAHVLSTEDETMLRERLLNVIAASAIWIADLDERKKTRETEALP